MSLITKSRKALIIMEASVGVSWTLLAAATIVWRDWIEIIFNWDPDQNTGGAEIGIICGLALAGAALVLIARWQNRRWHSLGAASDAT
jgi:hypothetical protein